MADERGISESELVGEIVEAWKDVQMHRDKIDSCSDSEGDISRGDFGRTDLFYAQHVACLDKVMTLVSLGKKYFQYGETDWSKYDLENYDKELPSWMNPELPLRKVILGREKMVLTSAPEWIYDSNED